MVSVWPLVIIYEDWQEDKRETADSNAEGTCVLVESQSVSTPRVTMLQY